MKLLEVIIVAIVTAAVTSPQPESVAEKLASDRIKLNQVPINTERISRIDLHLSATDARVQLLETSAGQQSISLAILGQKLDDQITLLGLKLDGQATKVDAVLTLLILLGSGLGAKIAYDVIRNKTGNSTRDL